MTRLRLVWQGVCHRPGLHLGTLCGAAIASAILVGALIVGDSVRGSLRKQSAMRLGAVEYAAESRDRLFTSALAARLAEQLATGSGDSTAARHAGTDAPVTSSPALPGTLSPAVSGGEGDNNETHDQATGRAAFHRRPTQGEGTDTKSLAQATTHDPLAPAVSGGEGREMGSPLQVPTAAVLLLPGTVSRADGEARANGVQVLGVDDDFWTLSPAGVPQLDVNEPDRVAINRRLATQLRVNPDDEILIRFPKPSALSRDAPLAPEENSSATLRLRVGAVVPDRGFGDFSLNASQIPPFNVFVPARVLQARAGVTNRSNVLLVGKPRGGTSPAPAAMVEVLRAAWTLADAQLEVRPLPGSGTVEIRSSRVFLDPPLAGAATRGSAAAVRILTYFVNELRAGDRATPYSMVTAADPPFVPADLGPEEILISSWLADDLGSKVGDRLTLRYYIVGIGRALEERTATFSVRGIVPMADAALDPTLMPDFPGLTDADNCRDWDTGFPIDNSKIREKDEKYWDDHRGTPKAFVSLATGQRLWGNRFGDLTAVRHKAADTTGVDAVSRSVLAALDPATVGLQFQPVRALADSGVTQSQDFGGLFIGFSFFLIAAALILTGLLFQFSLEQRAPEIGTLLALGFAPRSVRRLLLLEGVVVAGLGGLLGVVGGVFYAKAMIAGLTTAWRDAVGTTALEAYIEPVTLAAGWGAGLAVAVITLQLALRRQARQPVRALLAGETHVEFEPTVLPQASAEVRKDASAKVPPHPGSLPFDKLRGEGELAKGMRHRDADGDPPSVSPRPFDKLRGEGARRAGEGVPQSVEPPRDKVPGVVPRELSTATRSVRVPWASRIAIGSIGAAVAMAVLALAGGGEPNPGLFFGAGALLLAGGLAASLWRLTRMSLSGTAAAISQRTLALRNGARRPRRSLATIGLIASGTFLVASIGVFRLDAVRGAALRSSGTGGFAFIGGSSLPVVHDLNKPAGRDFFGLEAKAMEGVAVVALRVRDGEEASCLNLNRAQRPRLVGVDSGALESRGAFTFTRTHSKPAGHPWSLLRERQPDGAVPAIGDQASIQWALGRKVGDTLDFVDERGVPFKVRIVGAVANSILQGNLLIDEAAFVERFPGESGYRMFLIDAPSERMAAVAADLSRALRDVGLELAPASRRLAEFNAVQNTYLGTFQVLGGLGLVLGSIGLGVMVSRNVLERRGELALMLALGFVPSAVRRIVLTEHLALLAAGLCLGLMAAVLAVLPALWVAGTEVPYRSLSGILAGIALSGWLWTELATRLSLRGRLLEGLRSE